MPKRPVVLNFSGNDSAGFAGLSMDVRTQSTMGVHSASVITANTAQNNTSVTSINAVQEAVFSDQVKANENLPIDVVKAGLLVDKYQLDVLGGFLNKRNIPLVLDPVLKSSSGKAFTDLDFLNALKRVLLPHCTLLTPNIDEAELLTGISINTTDDLVSAAKQLLAFGAKAVLLKGGHFCSESNHLAQDYFSDGEKSFWLASHKIQTKNSRGTGCALSSAIASAIALGYSLYDAVVIGKMAISQGLRESYGLGGDHDYGPVNINRFPNQQVDLPLLTNQAVENLNKDTFPECNQPLLGLYPVVDRAEWIKKLIPSGISTIQLRVKDLQGKALEEEIQKAIKVSQENNVRLFINDYWSLAIQYGAYGVHLGQEDLDDADIDQIKEAGLRLGISTHCHYEVARAHSYRPSYIACGPVYHTTTKDMPWVPHGLAGLRYWRQVLDYPLVAIGGINDDRFDGIASIGVDSIAMITAITLAKEPHTVAKQFINRFEVAHCE
ncbi:MAG: thiamine phosphate synthase [Cellvibrionaceae bacterium]